jgi:hypothetical protein
MKYDNLGIVDFCNLLTGTDVWMVLSYDWTNISKVDLYNYVKNKTENFQPVLLKIFVEELRESASEIYFLMPNTPEGKMRDGSYFTIEKAAPLFRKFIPLQSFPADKSLRERIEDMLSAMPTLIFKKGVKKLFQLSDIAEMEYQRVSEPAEIEEFNVNKTKLNRRQKVALLESTGVLKYLETNVFAGNQTKIAEYLSLLLELNQQNIRKEISGATELLLSDPKITKVINPILSDLGLMCKE